MIVEEEVIDPEDDACNEYLSRFCLDRKLSEFEMLNDKDDLVTG